MEPVIRGGNITCLFNGVKIEICDPTQNIGYVRAQAKATLATACGAGGAKGTDTRRVIPVAELARDGF